MALRQVSLPSTSSAFAQPSRSKGRGPFLVVAQAARPASSSRPVRACSVLEAPATETEQQYHGVASIDMDSASCDWLEDYMSNITRIPPHRDLNFRPTKPVSKSRQASAVPRAHSTRSAGPPSSKFSVPRVQAPSGFTPAAGRASSTATPSAVYTHSLGQTADATDVSSTGIAVERRRTPRAGGLPRAARRVSRMRTTARRNSVALDAVPALEKDDRPQTPAEQFLSDMTHLVEARRLSPADQARCCEMIQASAAADGIPSQDVTKAKRLAEALLMNANTGAITNLAMKYQNDLVTVDDLVSAGLMYVTRAARNFRVGKGTSRFGTYLYSCVRPIMANMAYRQATVLDLPERVHRSMRKVATARSILHNGSSNEPTLEEIATASDLTTEKVQQAVWAERLSAVSMEDTDWDGPAYSRLVPSGESGDVALRNRMAEELPTVIDELLSKLTERERNVLILRYGLGNEEKSEVLSAAATAKALGISRSGCHKAEARAIQKLKECSGDLRMFEEAILA